MKQKRERHSAHPIYSSMSVNRVRGLILEQTSLLGLFAHPIVFQGCSFSHEVLQQIHTPHFIMHSFLENVLMLGTVAAQKKITSCPILLGKMVSIIHPPKSPHYLESTFNLKQPRSFDVNQESAMFI